MSETLPFTELMPRLRGRARRLARSAEEADDLVQEVALNLWQRAAKHGDIDDPERYAMIMLRHLAYRRWRRQTATEPLAEDDAVIAPEAPGRLACGELRAAIDTLPDDQRRVMEMVAAGETSPAVLARVLDLPRGTVMSRLARARAKLRREMDLAGPVSELL